MICLPTPFKHYKVDLFYKTDYQTLVHINQYSNSIKNITEDQKKFTKVKFKKTKQYYKGVSGHIPRNIVLALAWTNLFKDRPAEGFIISNLISHIA